MKDEKLELTDGENSSQDAISGIAENPFQPKPEIPQEFVKVPILGTVSTGYPNYKKLCETLRDDMRRAAEELLSLRRMNIKLINEAEYINGLAVCKGQLWEIDRALAFLDCTDHIKPESDEDAAS